MKTNLTMLLFGVLFSLGLAACSTQAETLAPPEIAYGQDVCEACSMLIDQPELAAATVDTAGQAHKFDEIGDMMQFHAEHPTIQAVAWFVHDYNTQKWLRAEVGYFVYSPDLLTTMGHGIVSFATEADATAFATEHGADVLSFDEARAVVATMVHANH
jgi:copper chaperone NosL